MKGRNKSKIRSAHQIALIFLVFIFQSCGLTLLGEESTEESPQAVTDPNPYFVSAVSGEYYLRIENIADGSECDGILISADYALARQDCIGSNPNYADFRVNAGEIFGGGVGGAGTQQETPTNHYPHSNYNSQTLAYNFIILKVNPIAATGVILHFDVDSADGLLRFSALNSVRDFIATVTGI